MNNYNTGRDALLLKEYGRNVQNMIRQVAQIEDKYERSQAARLLVDILKQLNPAVKEHSDNLQRIWDHLHLMTNYELDIDSPYPAPSPNYLVLNPTKLEYKNKGLKFKHYGRNIEYLVAYTLSLEDEADKLNSIAYIGRLIKNFYTQWSKEAVDDNVIIEHLKKLSDGKISLTVEYVREIGLFDGNLNGENPRTPYHQNSNYQNRKKPTYSSPVSNTQSGSHLNTNSANKPPIHNSNYRNNKR